MITVVLGFFTCGYIVYIIPAADWINTTAQIRIVAFTQLDEDEGVLGVLKLLKKKSLKLVSSPNLSVREISVRYFDFLVIHTI